MCKLVLKKKTPVPYDTPENVFSDDDLVDYARHLEMPIRMVESKSESGDEIRTPVSAVTLCITTTRFSTTRPSNRSKQTITRNIGAACLERVIGEKCFVPRPIWFSTTYELVTANQKFANSPLEMNCYQS
ncbi:hypothetical protein TNIN_396181 [Trichonephila inaurata madagascariensis]|uniref:Uncharacterized protein n=1 Tax=Trichonephila inaurata madagascariensis TaxID=2747483 RepID=A0A8X6X6S8_9ARAC|nr:hypothetical protein TNIN_396181 [Trichonephila inaurata madagascariensis]